MNVTMKLLQMRQYLEAKKAERPNAKADYEFFHAILDIVDHLSMEVDDLKKEVNPTAFIDPNSGPSSIGR